MAARRRTPNVAAWQQTGSAKPAGAVSGVDLCVGWPRRDGCVSPLVWSAGAYFHQSTMACCRVEANMVARLLTWEERQTQVEWAPQWPPLVRHCPTPRSCAARAGGRSGRARADGSRRAGCEHIYALWGEGKPRRACLLSLAASRRSVVGPPPCACGSTYCWRRFGGRPSATAKALRGSNLRKSYGRDFRKAERQAMIQS
jgi:hypothetical protein